MIPKLLRLLIEQTVHSHLHAVKLLLFSGTQYASTIELIKADQSVLVVGEVCNAQSCEVEVQTANPNICAGKDIFHGNCQVWHIKVRVMLEKSVEFQNGGKSWLLNFLE